MNLAQFTVFGLLLVVIESGAVPLYKSDSPQHIIRHYRSSPDRTISDKVATTGDSDVIPKEDGQLMYIMIKPAPRKFEPSSDKIYMDGVNMGEKSNRTDKRLELASGAYPVFYSIAHANGNFGRSIRALSKSEIEKYT